MNSPSSNKKLLILMGIFLIVVSSFVIADLIINPSSFPTFAGEPTESEYGSFTLNNSFVNRTISILEYSFVPSSLITGSSLTPESITFTDEVYTIENGTISNAVDFVLEMPQGLDAIDDEFKVVTWNIGIINISGFASNNTLPSDKISVVQNIDLNVQIENNLIIDKVEFESSGEDPRNISSGSIKSVQDGDSVSMKIFYKNTFTKDLAFDKDNIIVNLIIDGDELDTQEGNHDVDMGEFGEAVVEFDVNNFDLEKYPVELRLEGLTTAGGRHGEVFKFEIEVGEEEVVPDVEIDSDNDGVTDDLDLCPGTNILCISDEAGCEMDPDKDGICNGVDRTPNGEVREEQTTQNTISKQTESNKDEIEESIVVKKESGSGGTGSFFFGLIVGFIGAALFFTLTKI